MNADEKFYVVRLLWINDPEGFDEYQGQARPAFARHGVTIERWIETAGIEGDGMEKPDAIVVTWFEDEAAFRAFEEDPDFKRASEIRNKAATLVTITGKSVFGD